MTPKKNYQNIKEADVGEEEKREKEREIERESERDNNRSILGYVLLSRPD